MISRPTFFFFNGDADGLIAQHLLALSGVTPLLRISGLKRDLALLGKIPPRDNADVYVLDVNVKSNRSDLDAWLDCSGTSVHWFDHHEPGALPHHPRLHANIQTAAGVCTALLVHRFVSGSDARWAATAAFGDNLAETGEALLSELQSPQEDIQMLRELGGLLNYNAYGETLEDVLMPPLQVAELLSGFQDPLQFYHDAGLVGPLRDQLREDEKTLAGLHPREIRGRARTFWLPPEPWARRIGSTFANQVVRENPESALAVFHPLHDGNFQVSLRLPRKRLDDSPPISQLALEFPTGGGRALAAGVNQLPPADLHRFEKRFFEVYG